VTAVVLALVASVGWGVSDFIGGLQTRRIHLLAVLAVTLPSGLLVLGPILAVRAEGPPGAGPLAWACLAGVSGAIGLGSLYQALAIGTMGIVAPITAAAPLVPVTVGLARGERPSALQTAGIAVAVVGVVLVGRERSPNRVRRLALGGGLALLAAAGFGTSFVALAETSKGDPYWGAFVVRLVTIALVAGAIAATRPAVRAAVRALPVLVVAGLLDATATTLYSVSTTYGLLSVVAVLTSLYSAVTVLLARAVLGERLAAIQLVGAAAALGGAALMAAG